MGGFKDLVVWQRSKALAVTIYQLTSQGDFSRDFALKDQMRRAAVSIPSNIAEGDERDTNREPIHFLYIAKGSLAELVTQLEIAYEIGYINAKQLNEILLSCSNIGKMLGSLIKARTQNR